MTLLNKIYKYFLEYIGPSGYVLYSFIYFKNKKEKTKFTYKNLTEGTKLGIKTIDKTLKLLNGLKIVYVKKTLKNKKNIWNLAIIREIDWSVKNTESLYLIYINSYNSINSYNTNITSITNNINKGIRTKENLPSDRLLRYKNKVIKNILLHPRFNNNFYKTKFKKNNNYDSLTEKEKQNLTRLKKIIKAKELKKYIAWWVRNKSKTFSGFSFGAIAYQEFLEEYQIKVLKINLTKKAEKKKSISRHNKQAAAWLKK